MTDSPSDMELHAYVDDQLDPGRKFAIETHLARDPVLAAQVMRDLGTRTALRLLSDDNHALPSALKETAAALPAASPRHPWRRVGSIGGLSLGALVMSALIFFGGPPSYVDLAVASHRVAQMRAHMHSQIEAPALDAREILARAHIDLPHLPAAWHVTDVQLFPTSQGPALLVAVRTGEGQSMSIFALRQKSGAPVRPDAVREGRQSVAYWRRGDMSYALTGETDPYAIDKTAEALAKSWL